LQNKNSITKQIRTASSTVGLPVELRVGLKVGDNVGEYVGKVGDRVGEKDLLSDVVKERKMEKHKIFQNKTRNSSSYNMNKQQHKKR